jgi:glucose-6-phosphate 1-epimerase
MGATTALEKVELKTGKASATVYPFGATVTSYKAPHEVLFVRPDAKMDGSKPISGGIPHCFPQFGPGAIQQHGFARNLVWTVASKSEKDITLELSENDETMKMWCVCMCVCVCARAPYYRRNRALQAP